MANNYIERSFFALGTFNHIRIYNCSDDTLLDAAQKRVCDIDDRMSVFKPDSEISRMNNHSGRGLVDVSEDTLRLLKRSVEFSEISGGAFDITIRPLVDLWGIGKKNSYIPSDIEIDEARKCVDYRSIMTDDIHCRAGLARDGQAVDLGGIAKGFAADEVKRILSEACAESAIINLGGNIVAVGNRVDGSPWHIGIQNPLGGRGQYIRMLEVSDKTIVTSGVNERFFIKDGVRYHHILDPRTGRPAAHALLSVTAVCACSMDADAMTTALYVLGPGAGTDVLNRIKMLDFEAVFITDKLEIITSEKMRKRRNEE